MKKSTTKISSDYDSGWKEIIEIYFPEFVKFYYPSFNKLIDYKKGYQFLDKQLLKIVTEVPPRKNAKNLSEACYHKALWL